MERNKVSEGLVVGFFDVDRVYPDYAEQLVRAGWVPVVGDPHRAAAWRKSWVERFVTWVLGR